MPSAEGIDGAVNCNEAFNVVDAEPAVGALLVLNIRFTLSYNPVAEAESPSNKNDITFELAVFDASLVNLSVAKFQF